MIKNTLLIAAIIFSINLKAQKLLNSIELNKKTSYYGKSSQIFNVNDSEFLMIQRLGYQINLVKYDHELNEKGNFKIEDKNLVTTFSFIEDENKLISFEFSTTGKRRNKTYSIVSTLFDVEEEKYLNKVILHEEEDKFHDVISSKNGQYFALVHIPEDRYDDPFEFIIYNSASMDKLGTIEYDLPKRADVDGINLSNDGKLITATLTAESELTFQLYDKNGELLKTIEKETIAETKQYFKDIIFKDNDDSATMAISYAYDDYELTGIQTFEINFKDLSINSIHNVKLDKDFVKSNLYQNVYGRFDDKWGDTAPIGEEGKNPKRLKGFRLTDFYKTKSNELIYQLEEHEYKQIKRGNRITEYFTIEDLLLVSFDNSGKFKYSTVFDKKTVTETTYRNPYLPGFSAIRVKTNLNQDKLTILSKESTGFASSCIVSREMDLKSGKIIKMQPLFQECDYNSINNNFTKWISPNKLVTVKMNGIESVMSKTKLNLQLIQL